MVQEDSLLKEGKKTQLAKGTERDEILLCCRDTPLRYRGILQRCRGIPIRCRGKPQSCGGSELRCSGIPAMVMVIEL
jgi:hypothetical protein